jgi:hypothetical protein
MENNAKKEAMASIFPLRLFVEITALNQRTVVDSPNSVVFVHKIGDCFGTRA